MISLFVKNLPSYLHDESQMNVNEHPAKFLLRPERINLVVSFDKNNFVFQIIHIGRFCFIFPLFQTGRSSEPMLVIAGISYL